MSGGTTTQEIDRDERLLNVFRSSNEDTLTTQEIAAELSIGERAVQKRLKQLQSEGRVTIDTEGKPIHWRLGETEPETPVYHPRIAKVKRRANRASDLGEDILLVAISMLGAAGFAVSLSIYSRGTGIPIPPFRDVGVAVLGTYIGVAGAGLFGIAGLTLGFGLLYPRAAEWRFERSTDGEK